MKFNLTLIAVGIILIFTGVYRACPVPIDRKFFINGGPFIIALGLLIILAFILGNMILVQKGARATLQIGSQYLLMLLVLIPIMGFGMVIAQAFQQPLHKLVSGTYGFWGMLAGGFIIPGSTTAAKFVETLWNDPTVRPQLLYLLTVMPLISWQIFLIRQIGLGWEISLVMYKINVLVALGLMPVFWAYSKLIR